MQKITFLLALLGTILGLYAITHSNGGMTPTKTETVAERVLRTGTIRCGYNTLPKYLEKIEDQKFKGFIYDLMEETGKRLSLKIDWAEEAPWDAALTGITTGRYDMFCFPLYINANRARVAVFSLPVGYLPTYIVMRADDNRYNGTKLDDLNNQNYTMSIMDGDISLILSNQLFPNAKKHSLSQAQGWPLIIRDVANKKADFAVVDRNSVEDFNATNKDKLKIVGAPISTNAFGFPLPNDLQFKSMIDSALLEMQQDGTLGNILKKHDYTKYVLLPTTPYREK